MQKDRVARIAGFVMALALAAGLMTGTASAATHTVFAEFGTATW